VVEPTCGQGAFVIAAAETFPGASLWGGDINTEYLARARAQFASSAFVHRAVQFEHVDCFALDWGQFLAQLPEPLLVLGNPPWVTTAEMCRLGGDNLPTKSNIHQLRGYEAISGRSNFDVSEWLLLQLLEGAQGKVATVAMLCKAAVARRVVEYALNRRLEFRGGGLFRVDARAHFDAAVEACFFVFQTGSDCLPVDGCPVIDNGCPWFADLGDSSPGGMLALRHGLLVSDGRAFDRWQEIAGDDEFTWRSGIKHDCARVMELKHQQGRWRNGLREEVVLEEDYLYPLVKSSDIAQGVPENMTRRLVLPQRHVGEATAPIEGIAPRTWAYLQRHSQRLAKRASVVYERQPPFAVFGVGPYAFAPWKVVVSGMYKELTFRVVGPHQGKPVMCDDTCYYLPWSNEADARRCERLLATAPAQEFLESLIFWDAKRPVTKQVLERLNLSRLASLVDGEGWSPEAG
jgi:hypothetical protein